MHFNALNGKGIKIKQPLYLCHTVVFTVLYALYSCSFVGHKGELNDLLFHLLASIYFLFLALDQSPSAVSQQLWETTSLGSCSTEIKTLEERKKTYFLTNSQKYFHC